MTITLPATRPYTAHASGPILPTMSFGVLSAQIDTSVVNLAVKQIGVDFNANNASVGRHQKVSSKGSNISAHIQGRRLDGN